jgi:hypothetical protein
MSGKCTLIPREFPEIDKGKAINAIDADSFVWYFGPSSFEQD